MLRHPFYILLCLIAVGYLAFVDVRGRSLWQSLTRSLQSRSGGTGSAFHHK